jgi:hypothetical protein
MSLLSFPRVDPLAKSPRQTRQVRSLPTDGTGQNLQLAPAQNRRHPLVWILLGGLLLACLYLPMLRANFDFIDDGNLVYPSPGLTFSAQVERIWDRILSNYHHLGPFRPVLWVHWETAANLLQADPLSWRCLRWLWTALAASCLLWLLRELGIRPSAALLATALAMWNPFRNEIWRSLSLAEGVAMPYALVSLVCALRASRSRRPWAWDLAGAACVVAALGCKNTYAALIPVQLLLRIAPDGKHLWRGLRQHWRPASLLSLTALLPIGHYLCFQLTWHPGQYETQAPSLAQFRNMLRAVTGAVSLDFMGLGLFLAAVAILADARAKQRRPTAVANDGHEMPSVWETHHGALLAGLALLAFGIGVYLPMAFVSGRYTMPAVWGADLWIAVLLHRLVDVTTSGYKRAAYIALAGGLVTVAVSALGKQDAFAARSHLLWQALQAVENQAVPGSCLGWQSGPRLDLEEGIHFQWHLNYRGQREVAVCLLDADRQPRERVELPPIRHPPELLLSGEPLPPGTGWQPLQEFKAFYWGGWRSYHCYLYRRG